MPGPARFNVGNSPAAHMLLLSRAPERVLALRFAMASAVGPSSVVLDAGCGSLGVLAIMAARLGARRVVAVDHGRLDAARALAAENGVADRIEFRECDLADLPADSGNFDVILGMVYYNEPRRDLGQQRLMAGVVTRFAHSGTVFIPDTVRYTVAGYDSTGLDRTDRTRRDGWDSAVDRAEALTGITLASIRRFPGPDYAAIDGRLPLLLGSRVGQRGGRGLRQRRWAARVRRALAGPGMTLLTGRQVFAEISYADPATALAYPPALALTATAAGRLDTTIWHQELKVGGLLLRDTATVYPLTPPRDVKPGDTAVLSTDGGWDDSIPLTIRRLSPVLYAWLESGGG